MVLQFEIGIWNLKQNAVNILRGKKSQLF